MKTDFLEVPDLTGLLRCVWDGGRPSSLGGFPPQQQRLPCQRQQHQQHEGQEDGQKVQASWAARARPFRRSFERGGSGGRPEALRVVTLHCLRSSRRSSRRKRMVTGEAGGFPPAEVLAQPVRDMFLSCWTDGPSLTSFGPRLQPMDLPIPFGSFGGKEARSERSDGGLNLHLTHLLSSTTQADSGDVQ